MSLTSFFDTKPLINILDVGAAPNGTAPYDALVRAGCARLIGFEPDAASCQALRETYGPPHQFYEHFIGDGGPAIFHETNWSLTGSLYPPNTELLNKFFRLGELVVPVAQHPIQTRTLDSLTDLGDVDLIKIDVQGAELAIFRNALKALGSSVMVITEVEFVELYRGQPLFADVDQFLRAVGYSFHAFNELGQRSFKPIYNHQHPVGAINQLLWADAVYVKDWMRLHLLAPEKLQKYAILAHDYLRSFDLAHHVLEALDLQTQSHWAEKYRETYIGKGAQQPT